MEWFQNSVYADFIATFYQTVRLPPAERDPAALAEIEGRMADRYALLDRDLHQRRFVAGDRFTIGDIPIGASLFRYFDMPIERPGLPAFATYYDRLADRQASRTFVMTSYEALRSS